MNRSVGVVVQRLHTLNHTSLETLSTTRLTARTPLLQHPQWLAAAVGVAAFADGFGLLVDLTEVPVHQTRVTFPPTAVFGVLNTSAAGFGAL